MAACLSSPESSSSSAVGRFGSLAGAWPDLAGGALAGGVATGGAATGAAATGTAAADGGGLAGSGCGGGGGSGEAGAAGSRVRCCASARRRFHSALPVSSSVVTGVVVGAAAAFGVAGAAAGTVGEAGEGQSRAGGRGSRNTGGAASRVSLSTEVRPLALAAAGLPPAAALAAASSDHGAAGSDTSTRWPCLVSTPSSSDQKSGP
mmetsp:Transcript_6762/g.21139  ORF Transcript_6762/g.21139 Transcript_6762/m.21139 type:complete len:205 (-) Transcript_6762:107-721(-)